MSLMHSDYGFQEIFLCGKNVCLFFSKSCDFGKLNIYWRIYTEDGVKIYIIRATGSNPSKTDWQTTQA